MIRGSNGLVAFAVVLVLSTNLALAENRHSFLCQEPGGKRLIEFSGENGKEVSKPGG